MTHKGRLVAELTPAMLDDQEIMHSNLSV